MCLVILLNVSFLVGDPFGFVMDEHRQPVQAGEELRVVLWAENKSGVTALLNGRFIPTESGQDVLDQMNTPFAFEFTRATDKGKIERVIRLVRLKNTIAVDAGKKALVFSEHIGKQQDVPGVTLIAPPKKGTWALRCLVAIPFPDPTNPHAPSSVSNTISIDVR